MKKRKIGVMIESFRLGVENGIRKAAEGKTSLDEVFRVLPPEVG